MTAFRDLDREADEAQAAHDKARGALKSDFAATFGSAHGARVLAHLAIWGKVFATTYVHGTPRASAFNEGIRNAILYCLSMSDRLNLPTDER